MARIEKEFFVDVSERTTFENIFAKQFDCKSRFLKVTLTNRGEKLSIDQNSTVTINSLRRDGKASSFLGIVNAE